MWTFWRRSVRAVRASRWGLSAPAGVRIAVQGVAGDRMRPLPLSLGWAR